MALVPTFGLFCYTALLSSQVDRVPGTVAYLACALAFVIAADRSTVDTRSERRATTDTGAGAHGHDQPTPARRRARAGAGWPRVSTPRSPPCSAPRGRPRPPGGEPGSGDAQGGRPALRASRVESGRGPGPGSGRSETRDGEGVGAGTGGFPGSTGVRAIDLVDDLKAVLVNRTTELMFSAQTPLPTYWQLAVLTRFNGTAWLPDPTTEAAAQSDALPPPSHGRAGPPRAPRARAHQDVPRPGHDRQSREHAVAPAPHDRLGRRRRRRRARVRRTAAVRGGTGAELRGRRPRPGRHLHVAASTGRAQAGARRAPARLGHGAAGRVASRRHLLAPYLQLPTEPAAVVQLAHQIVAGATGPAAEAAALARWFDTGRYRYTLSPPALDGPRRAGVVPLHHPGRVLSAVRRRLRRAGTDRRPAHAGGGRVHDGRHAGPRPRTGSPGPTRTYGPRCISARRRDGRRTSRHRPRRARRPAWGSTPARAPAPRAPGPGPRPPRLPPRLTLRRPGGANATVPLTLPGGRPRHHPGAGEPGPVLVERPSSWCWPGWRSSRPGRSLGAGVGQAADGSRSGVRGAGCVSRGAVVGAAPRPTRPPRSWPSGVKPRWSSSAPGLGRRPAETLQEHASRLAVPGRRQVARALSAGHDRSTPLSHLTASATSPTHRGSPGPRPRSRPRSTPTGSWPAWRRGPATRRTPAPPRKRPTPCSSAPWCARVSPPRPDAAACPSRSEPGAGDSRTAWSTPGTAWSTPGTAWSTPGQGGRHGGRGRPTGLGACGRTARG